MEIGYGLRTAKSFLYLKLDPLTSLEFGFPGLTMIGSVKIMHIKYHYLS